MSTIAPTLDAASPKRRAISPPSLKTSVEPNGPYDVDRRGDADSSPSATMKLLQVVRVAAFITHN